MTDKMNYIKELSSEQGLTIESIGIMINAAKEIIKSLRKELDTSKEAIAKLVDKVSKLENENEILRRQYKDLNEKLEAKNNELSISRVELEQKFAKRQNVIIADDRERESGPLEERQAHDRNEVTLLMRYFDISWSHIERIDRIGRPRIDGKRLLRVICKSVECKSDIFRNSKKSRHSKDFQHTYINPDTVLPALVTGVCEAQHHTTQRRWHHD